MSATTAAKFAAVIERRMSRLNSRYGMMDETAKAAAKRRVANLSGRWLLFLGVAREGGAL